MDGTCGLLVDGRHHGGNVLREKPKRNLSDWSEISFGNDIEVDGIPAIR